MTLASAWPGFIVKTRQQPSEACVATRTSVTPTAAALGPGVSASLSIADEVQAGSETNITKQGNADQRILSMPDGSYARGALIASSRFSTRSEVLDD